VQSCLELGGERGMDAALALDAGYAFKMFRYQLHRKMGFAGPAIGARSPGMTGMAGAFIVHLDEARDESGSQFVLNGVNDGHPGLQTARPASHASKFACPG
jgi:hypothetical protein